MKPAINSPHPLAPLALRRRLVVTGALGLITLLASQFLRASGVDGAAWNPLAVVGIIVMVFGWTRLIIPGYLGLPRMDQPDLDERQRAVVTTAYALAYRVVVVGLLATCSYLLLTDLFTKLPELGGIADGSLLVIGLVWIVMGLPAAILAWNEPDPAD